MISSEAQRTLVKSPPELWTELSDPESLARHLGELGEIKITRTEPENLVEWEAQGTTGTVELAPSGWGTRVTLTVLRELPEADGQAGEEPDDAPGTAGEAGEPPQPEASDGEAEPGEDPETTVSYEPEGAAQAALAGEPAAVEAAEPAETVDSAAESGRQGAGETAAQASPAAQELAADAPEDPIAEHKPAPATEAARRAARWPSAHTPAAPAIESDLRAAEALGDPPPESGGLASRTAESAQPGEPELRSQDEPFPEPEPEPPKRGLFARLFGRRRGRAEKAAREQPAQPGDVLDGEPVRPGEHLDEEPALAPGDEPLDAAGPETPAQPDDEPLISELDAVEATLAGQAEDGNEIVHAEVGALGTPATEADDLEAAGREPGESDAALPAPGAPAPEVDEPLSGIPAGELEADLPAPGAPAPEVDEPLSSISAGELEAGPQGAQADTAPAPESSGPAAGAAPEPPADLAAELQAAEEVEAVLTAVLDRLGSAHHRPFSRP